MIGQREMIYIRRLLATVVICVFSISVTDCGKAIAASDPIPLIKQQWSFDGIFGEFDKQSVQRGLQVYLEICASCHGLEYVAYRNLSEVGYTEEQIKAVASQYEVEDGPNSDGEIFTRTARPADYFNNPYANDMEAKLMNNGALPPDLSLIYKARPGGADYLYSLLTGYEEEPENHEVADGLYYNPYFPGGAVAMPQPLYGDDVEYADGTDATIAQQAHDVATFLAWAAEPNLDSRKKLGIKVLLFLIVLSGLLYASKTKVWREVH